MICFLGCSLGKLMRTWLTLRRFQQELNWKERKANGANGGNADGRIF